MQLPTSRRAVRAFVIAGSAAALLALSGVSVAQTDEEIVQMVRQELASYPGLVGGLEDGIVTVSGSVDDKNAVDQIKAKLMEIPGVTEVRSSIVADG